MPVMQSDVAFTELGRLVVGGTPLGQVWTRVAELTAACVPGVQEVSVTVVEGDTPRTVSATGTIAATLDERQYAAGCGPCLDAAETEEVVRVDDTVSAEVYPDFAAVAARQGVRSVLSIGLPMPQKVAGAINVYRLDPDALDEDAVEVLRVFSGYAAVALANHTRYASAVTLSEQMTAAMQRREVIDLAKGVLISWLRCSPDEAFAHLARQAQHTKRTLPDVAADIVRRAGGV